MKKTLTFVLTIFCVSAAFAQSQFYNIAVGASAGVTYPFTDLNDKRGVASTFGGSLDYYFTPFLNAGVEYNMVTLKEGPESEHKRQYKSDFSSIEIRVGASLGQFVDYTYNDVLYALRGLNLSLGYGIINGENNVGDFGRENEPGYSEKYEFFRRHGADRGKSTFKNVSSFPITIGYNFVFYNQYDEQKVLLGINMKSVFTNSDDINGYSDDKNVGFQNKAKDFYTTFGISLKYMFGPRNIYY